MQTTYWVYEGIRVLKVNVISLPYIFQVLYVLCFTRPRYQLSVYRSIGPLVWSSAPDFFQYTCILMMSSLGKFIWRGIFLSKSLKPWICHELLTVKTKILQLKNKPEARGYKAHLNIQPWLYTEKHVDMFPAITDDKNQLFGKQIHIVRRWLIQKHFWQTFVKKLQ